MKKERAEMFYTPSILCPLCEHLVGTQNGLDEARGIMIVHLCTMHTEQEAKEMLGWIK